MASAIINKMAAQPKNVSQLSDRPNSSPLINGLPNMNGKKVDFQLFKVINSQLEDDEKENNSDPHENRNRFTKTNWIKYKDWRWDWLCNKIINENKVELDDLDLQEFRQFANTLLKPTTQVNN